MDDDNKLKDNKLKENNKMPYDELIKKLNFEIGYGMTYDIVCKEFSILERRMSLYFLSGLSDADAIMKISLSLNRIPKHMDVKYSFEQLYSDLSFGNVSITGEYQKIVDSILSGVTVLLIEDEPKILLLDTRSYPTRSISEPDIEKVIRGAHDGFTESIAVNTSLMRRRVKDASLRNELYSIGELSPINICISYIEGICDETLLKDLRKRLKEVQADHLIMADKALEELLLKQKFNPYPLVRYTERPDVAAIHLYQGMFAILVDTSPSVILAPATLLDHLQHAEEYRQTPLSGTYLRMLRYLGIFVSLFLVPLWLLLYKNNYFPGILAILAPSEDGINIFLQVMLAEIGNEMLRMASIHTPSSLSTAMGLIAGVLLGNIAITVGLFSIHVVLLVSVSAIGTYLTPSYELGLANKITKLTFILAILLFNIYGFIIAIILWIIFLANLKSMGKPYLYPIYPLDIKRLLKSFIRFPYKNKK